MPVTYQGEGGEGQRQLPTDEFIWFLSLVYLIFLKLKNGLCMQMLFIFLFFSQNVTVTKIPFSSSICTELRVAKTPWINHFNIPINIFVLLLEFRFQGLPYTENTSLSFWFFKFIHVGIFRCPQGIFSLRLPGKVWNSQIIQQLNVQIFSSKY